MEREIEKYIKTLVQQHPQAVLSFIIDMFSAIVDSEKKKGPNFDKDGVQEYFFRSLRGARELLFLKEKVFEQPAVLKNPGQFMPSEALENIRQDLTILLSQLSMHDALDFLAELIMSWGGLMPEKSVDEFLLLSSPGLEAEDKSPKNVSNILIDWLGRYFDLWS